MLMVVTDEGKVKLLFQAVISDGMEFEDYVLDVFVNDVTVDDDTVAADLTPATWAGYVQKALTRADFSAAAVDAFTHICSTELAPAPSWTCSGGTPQTAYGWMLRLATMGTLIAAGNLSEPRVMSGGATLTLDPFQIRCRRWV